MTTINLDFEVKSEIDLPTYGLDIYSSHPSTKVILCAFAFDGDKTPELWDYEEGKPFPRDVLKALADPNVFKKAFNAQFERIITRRVLKVDSPYKNWRCTMALAYQMSFSGGLGEVGAQMGLPQDAKKDAYGKKLIKLFCCPQRTTKKQPHRWLSAFTNPDQWEEFRGYCRQDVVAEMEIERRLSRYEIPEDEWRLYELDQKINDNGLPVDMQYVENALWMAAQRKQELIAEMTDVTGLANPNSGAQMLPWLRSRGYPFNDLQKDTVKKVLKENAADDGGFLSEDAVAALNLRRNATRTSIAKYDAFKVASGACPASEDPRSARFRFAFQFAGASRTQRWAGRRVQAQNLPRTPELIEDIHNLAMTTDLIRRGDYEGLSLMVGEPMEALVGCIRSAIRAPRGRVLRVCDLSSIETCVIAWLANCERLLKVIRAGYDAYKDFAVILYKGVYADFGTPEYEAAYADVTKGERTNSKPAVLGAGYRLGGGDLIHGKRTGLWGYAENMGIELTKDAAHKAVTAYREGYPEVPVLWKQYEDAIAKCLKSGQNVSTGPITFQYNKPFLEAWLPSGRALRYFRPELQKKTFTKVVGYEEDGTEITESWTKTSFTYMGQDQVSKKWVRIFSHGGKMVENFVQAIARDVLKYGLLDADAEGFFIAGHVHDEIITEQDGDDSIHTEALLGECMTRPREWAEGLPLGYGGWENPFYMK